MSEIVEVRNVSKHFGDFAALDDVSFTISPGSIVGLIGPNGAGKTTTLKSILGLTDFDGEMSVLGEDPRSGRHRIMERVCFIADVGVLPRWLRVSDALDYIQGIHPRFNRDRAEVMLAETRISKRHKVKELSKGMVTQLHLALVMAIEVDLLVLDEPTLGLDILFRKAFYIKNYYDLGNFLKSLSYLGLNPDLKDILKVCKKLRIKGQPGQLSNLAFCLNQFQRMILNEIQFEEIKTLLLQLQEKYLELFLRKQDG